MNSARKVIVAIGLVRTIGGAVGYVSPPAFARFAKLGPGAGTADFRYTTRLFGARDVVLGGWAMARPSRSLAVAGALCDMMDSMSALAAGKEGKARNWVRASAVIPALFAGAGFAAGIRTPTSRRDQ